MASFTQSQLEAIADALGDTMDGLTGGEIGHLLASARIEDTDPLLTKRHRLYNAFVHEQNARKDRLHIVAFIRKAMKPERYVREPQRFEPLRSNLNRALAFAGLAVNAAGELQSSEQATTLTEAARRAQELRADLLGRGVHPDVLRFCKQELLADNYFHAVLEATKSVADKVRLRTGLSQARLPFFSTIWVDGTTFEWGSEKIVGRLNPAIHSRRASLKGPKHKHDPIFENLTDLIAFDGSRPLGALIILPSACRALQPESVEACADED